MRAKSRTVYTAQVRTRGGRHGASRSVDGRLDISLSVPGSHGSGTNSEQLFAAAWSACFEGAITRVAHDLNVVLPSDITIDAEIDLNISDDGYFLSARLLVQMPGVDPNVAQTIIERAHQTCPYSKATRDNIGVQLELSKPTTAQREAAVEEVGRNRLSQRGSTP